MYKLPGLYRRPSLGVLSYLPSGELLSHADAEKLCASDGGRLVLINSEAEAQAFREKIKGMFKFILNVFHKHTREKLGVE